MASIPEIIEEVITLALADDFKSAKQALLSIDPAKLVKERNNALDLAYALTKDIQKPKGKFSRESVSPINTASTFHRDSFTCRYKHCQRRTIHPSVFIELSRIFPDIFPYHLHWKLDKCHILYWIYSTSIEHKISFPYGGNSSPENLITSCYLCNDVKNHHPFESLGWEITDPIVSDWDGLKKYIPQLKTVQHISLKDKSIGIMDDKNKKSIKITTDRFDLKDFPVGTIATNAKTQNRYLILMKTKDEITYFSNDENFTLKIKTKPLYVNIEFKPQLNLSPFISIYDIPDKIYTNEQKEFINKACDVWRKI